MEITLFIRGQKLEAHYPPLYSGSVGVLYARFAEIDFDKTLVKAVRFKTADSDWYTADIADGAVRVPHEVIVSGGFDIALAGYENTDGKLARFLPTNSIHINVEENGYGDPDAPIESEGEPASYTAKIEKLTSDAAAKADAAMAELEKKANAAEVYDKDTADALLGGKVDKESNAALSTVRSVSIEESPSQASTLTVAYQNGSSKTANYCTPSLTDKLLAELKEKSVPHKTVSGCPVTLADALAGERLRECRIYGSAAGVGDADGDAYKIPVRLQGKNLIPYPYADTTKTINGITFTVFGDGRITVNGTATGQADFIVISSLSPVGEGGEQYTLSGCPTGGSQSTYGMFYYDTVTSQYDTGDGVSFTAKGVISVTIRIREGAVCNNLTFSPMLENGAAVTGYEPYITPQVQTATLASPLTSGEYIDVLNKKLYASDGTATDITVEGELKTIESGSITIDCTTGVQPPRIEAEYWQDINKVVGNLTSAILANGGNA